MKRINAKSQKERVNFAVNEAIELLWERLSESFPQTDTGDLEPGIERELVEAMTKAAEAWVDTNVPSQAVATGNLGVNGLVVRPITVTVTMRTVRKGERMHWVPMDTCEDAEDALELILRDSETLGHMAEQDHAFKPDENGLVPVAIEIGVGE